MLLSMQEDPALTRWTYARTNIYPHFRPTAKTSLIGALFGVVPLFVLFAVFKTDRVSIFDYVLCFMTFCVVQLLAIVNFFTLVVCVATLHLTAGHLTQASRGRDKGSKCSFNGGV